MNIKQLGIWIIIMVALIIFTIVFYSKEIQSLVIENKKLNEQIKTLENSVSKFNVSINEISKQKDQQIKKLQIELSETKDLLDRYGINNFIANYVSYEHKKRFVNKETKLLVFPKNGAEPLSDIFANSVVNVEDAATNQFNNEIWLFVSIPVYEYPAHRKGWIKELDTLPYTKELQTKVQSPIFIKKGTTFYNDFDNISEKNIEELPYDVRGIIEEIRDSYARITPGAGWDFWVEKKYIIPPSIE